MQSQSFRLILTISSLFIIFSLRDKFSPPNMTVNAATSTPPSLETITSNNVNRLAQLTTIKAVESPSWSPDGHFLAVIDTQQNSVLIFDKSNFATPIQQLPQQSTYVEFSPNSKLLLCLEYKSRLNVYDVSTGKKIYGLNYQGMDFRPKFSSDSRLLGVQNLSSNIELIDASTGTQKLLISGYHYAFDFSPDAASLATMQYRIQANNQTQDIVWITDVKSGNHNFSIKTSDKHPTHIAFSPDGKFLAIHYANNGVSLLNIKTRQEQVFLNTQFSSDGGNLLFSQNKQLLAAIGVGKTYIWNYISGKELMLLDNLDLDQFGGTFNPDSSLWL